MGCCHLDRTIYYIVAYPSISAVKYQSKLSKSTWQCPCKPPWRPPHHFGETAALTSFNLF